MRERINRLAKGIIDSEIPTLEITPTEIHGAVRSGKTAKGEILVVSGNDLHLKGLVYSSNARVTIRNNAFGGLHNRLSYEINSSYLEDGDVIEGSFYLVTNGGEQEIPYSFRVELGTSGKTLKSLTTAADLAQTAKNDMDTALRLFEYQDFTEAPFMKDIHIRTLYDGLKGKPDRRNELEEFLVALKVKSPVELSVDCDDKIYENPLEITEDTVLLRTSNWGYVHIDIKADGDFIELPVKTVTDHDFADGKYELVFRIHPGKLHRGRNFGAIYITSARGDGKILVEAVGDETVDISDGEYVFDKEGWLKYLKLRLDYECGISEPDLLRNKMLDQLEQIELFQGRSDVLSLLRAENSIMGGQLEEACLILDECRENILTDRQEQVENYCFYQYLRLLTVKNDNQRESLIRLVNKYLDEEKAHNRLFLLLLKLDEKIRDNPEALLTRIRRQFKKGLKSPFLYAEVCRLLSKSPELLKGVDAFEMQALSYGSKHDLIGKELALAAAKFAGIAKRYHPLYYRLLVRLYGKYPVKELLEAVCGLLIKGEVQKPSAFPWYEKGVENGISLTRLYEYYLYALPSDYDRLLPREVLLYFSYGNELDRHSKSVLYQNILTYMKPGEYLYKDYERDIEKFAMDQLFESRINSRLAVIYEHMIYKDIIDVPVARVLPAVLRSYRVDCSDPAMKYVVVCYEELTDEDAFPLKEGVAYVPLFSENSVILLQDAYGNRYASADYKKVPVMEKPELEKRCFEIFPDHPMLKLRACNEVLLRGVESDEDAALLEHSMEELKLHPLYKRTMLSAVLAYYQKKSSSEEGDIEKSGGSYLIQLDKEPLTKNERQGICETLIAQNYIQEAYDMIRVYGYEGIGAKRLMKLCAKVILHNLFDQDELLLHIAWQVFAAGKNDSVILDYLCEHYNGPTDQMYKVLLQGVSEHVETYDLEERLVAQMLFTGSLERIDKVFDLYLTRKKTSENVVKAYFTSKSAEYFMEEKTPDDKVFSYLEGAVNGSIEKDKAPTVYLLALTKYYSAQNSLSEEQKHLCESMVSILLDENMIFPYFKALSKFVPMPEDIMDKGMIQYNGAKTSKVDLQVRVLPDESDFHGEDMRRVYQGIFVRQKVLFEGEVMEYKVYELSGEERVLKAEGSVTCELYPAVDGDSRFACLNEMGLCLNLKEEDGLKKKMEEYLMKNAAAEEIFQLM